MSTSLYLCIISLSIIKSIKMASQCRLRLSNLIFYHINVFDIKVDVNNVNRKASARFAYVTMLQIQYVDVKNKIDSYLSKIEA